MISALRKGLGMLPRDRRRMLVVIGAVGLLNSALEVVGVALVAPFMALVSDPNALATYSLLDNVYQFLGFQTPTAFLTASGVALVTVIVVKNGLFYLGLDVQNRFAFREAARMSRRILSGYLGLNWERLARSNSNDLITTANYSVDAFYVSVVLGFLGAVTEFLVLAGVVALLFVTAPLVTLAVLAGMGTLIGALYLFMHRWFEHFGRLNNQFYEDRLRALRHTFDAAKEIKLLHREVYFVDEYGRLREGNAEILRRNGNYVHLPRLAVETIVVAAIVGVVVVILVRGGETASIMPLLAMFAVAAIRVMPSANRLISALNSVKQGVDSIDRVHRALEQAKTYSPPTPTNLVAALPFEHEVTLDNVDFRYGDGPKVLDRVSLTIGHGESIGLVGPTGSGKSTLADVLMGLLQPVAGRVLVDGCDITPDPRPWQAQIGYVPQHICLIDDTVSRNVAFGLRDSEIDPDRVWHALQVARVADVVRALPYGLETRLGEDGMSLSGGQRQRLGLARALYRDPAVLVMDEATSALDGATEREVTQAIESLHGRKTLIIIAHRLATVRRCDRLVVLSEGRITGLGTFDQLLAESSEFRDMVGHSSPNGLTLG